MDFDTINLSNAAFIVCLALDLPLLGTPREGEVIEEAWAVVEREAEREAEREREERARERQDARRSRAEARERTIVAYTRFERAWAARRRAEREAERAAKRAAKREAERAA